MTYKEHILRCCLSDTLIVYIGNQIAFLERYKCLCNVRSYPAPPMCMLSGSFVIATRSNF